MCFLGLALLVLIAGMVGIAVVNKIAHSQNIVVKEKVPTEFSVMKINLAVENVQKRIVDYSSSFSNLDEKVKAISSMLDQLDMWIAMLEYGTASALFKKSDAYTLYQSLGLTIEVPKSTKELAKTIRAVKQESAAFRQSVQDLVKTQNRYVAYFYHDGDKYYELPTFLMQIQHDTTLWFNALESAALSVIKFEKNTDPEKTPLGIWMDRYRLDDEEFNTLSLKLKKYHEKLLATAEKINEKDAAAGKAQLLKRNHGNLIRVIRYIDKMIEQVESPFGELHDTKIEKVGHMTESGEKIRSELVRLMTKAENEMAAALERSEAVQKKGTLGLIALTLVALTLASVAGFYMGRYLTKGIFALAHVTKLISQGNLENDVALSYQDELGALADDTNIMSENLRNMIRQISAYSDQLTTSSSELNHLAVSMSDEARMMTQKSESVAAASEELSTNMNSVSAVSDEAVSNIHTVSDAAGEISSAITEISDNAGKGNQMTQKAVDRAGRAKERVDKLGDAANEIGQVTEVISKISEQTNLLALNATIEAARAGEAGKGFAVVASEIKQLALQTADATKDIRNRIEAIQNSTSETVEEIQGVAETVEGINEIVSAIASAVKEQSGITKDISENMSQAANGLKEASDNVAQSSRVSFEIAKDIGDVNAGGHTVSKNSERVRESSGLLRKLAGDLQMLIGQFTL